MLKSKTLDSIGLKHGTDKCGPRNGGHDYLRKYEFFLAPLVNENFTFLELGIFKGASLKTWADYFSRARIVGVDIEEETRTQAGGRVKVMVGDLAQTDFLKSLAELSPRVIVDDASHWWPDQLRALFILFPALASGGIYIVEDLQTSFEPLGPLFSAGIPYRPFNVLLKIAEYMTGNERPAPVMPEKTLQPISRAEAFHEEIRYIADHCDALTFIERACILIKK